MKVTLGRGTDPGLERADNEDAVDVLRNRGGVDVLLVVCDGMGGHAAGQEASRIAIATFVRALDGDGGRGPEPERLSAASAAANTAVHEAAQADSAKHGMGSTLVAVAIDGDQAALVNVGDSPAYLFHRGGWRLVSQDHSWPAEQARLGLITEEQARDHPMKHRLTRAIGVWEHVAAYTATFPLEHGDVVLLCSDGVETAGVSVDEMWALLGDGDLSEGIARVIERCRELGAPDNVTVAAARVEGDPVGTMLLKTLPG